MARAKNRREADSIYETILNVALADQLRSEGLDAAEEQPLTAMGDKRHRVDVLVDLDEFAVAIEAEYEPRTGREDAEKRLTKPPLVWRGLPIQAVYAIRYPKRLKYMAANRAYQALRTATDLHIVYRSGFSDGKWSVIEGGSIADLAESLRNYWARSDSGANIDEVVRLASEVIDLSADILGEMPGEKDSDPAATRALVWLNALLFQELLSQHLDPATLPPQYQVQNIPRPDPDGSVSDLLSQWEYILNINWWPIFHVARESLKTTPMTKARLAIDHLKIAAAQIAEQGVIRRHDITGRIFHRLLDTRKFLATNYTTIPAAILLAGLAFDDSHPLWQKRDWGDLETLRSLKIVDPACGSGTLLMAAVQEVIKRARRTGKVNETSPITKTLLENALYGFDVVPAAIHLAASTLSMSETSQLITNMNLWRMRHGVYDGVPRLGSLDMLHTSDTEGNADRLSLFDDMDDATRVLGTGEQKGTGVSFPQECDLVIANPPYTRAGGPGDEENTAWNPIFGSLMDKADQNRMNASLNRALKNTPAGMYAGLGSAFVVLANRDGNIKTGGRIAFVLPSAVVTGSSWRRIRELLLRQYEIDWVVTSHDPRQRSARKGVPGRRFSSFSESTMIAETLLVATKTEGNPKSNHKVRFLNLRRNPLETMDALSVTQAVLALPRDGGEVRIGGTSWGEVYTVSQSTLTDAPWMDTAFVQSRLKRTALQLIKKGSLMGHDIPVAPMADLWAFGPSEMQIKNPTQGLFVCDKGHDPMRPGHAALWHHKAHEITRLEVAPNAHLTPQQKSSEDECRDMLARAARLQFARELWSITQRMAAVLTPEPMLGVRSWISLKSKIPRDGDEEILCLWLNSTPGLLLRMVHANRPYLGRSLITHTSGATLLVLDVGALSEDQLQQGKQIFNFLCDRELMPIMHMDTDPVRRQIDDAIADLIGLPQGVFADLSTTLAHEPNIHVGKTPA